MFFPFSLFLGADSRSRGARAPWFVRSVDIFPSAFGSSAQLYLCGFRSLLTLSASAVGVLRSVDISLFCSVFFGAIIFVRFNFGWGQAGKSTKLTERSEACACASFGLATKSICLYCTISILHFVHLYKLYIILLTFLCFSV